MNSTSPMPQLGMGTFRLKQKVCYDAVSSALEVGFRHIDTAQLYDNEQSVGEAIGDSGIARDEIFVTTKVWNDKLNEKDFIPSVQESLDKLKLESVDLLLIHWPSPENNEPMQEYLAELASAKSHGLTRHVGVSNFTIPLLDQAQAILGEGEIFTNQVEVHPYLSNKKLRDYCAKNAIHITAYMPFAVGKSLKDETLVRIAEAHQVTTAEVIIAWQLAHGVATIPSSTKREHMETNLKGANLKLSVEDITAIDGLDRGERIATPGFSPDWD